MFRIQHLVQDSANRRRLLIFGRHVQRANDQHVAAVFRILFENFNAIVLCFSREPPKARQNSIQIIVSFSEQDRLDGVNEQFQSRSAPSNGDGA